MKRILPCVSLAAVCLVRPAAPAMAQDAPKQRPPVIDMHLHAVPAVGWPGGPSFSCPGQDFAAYDPSTKWSPSHMWETCPNPLYPVTSDEELLKQVLAIMDRYNIVLAATSGPLEYVRRYREAAPKRILPGINTSIANPGTARILARACSQGRNRDLGRNRAIDRGHFSRR